MVQELIAASISLALPEAARASISKSNAETSLHVGALWRRDIAGTSAPASPLANPGLVDQIIEHFRLADVQTRALKAAFRDSSHSPRAFALAAMPIHGQPSLGSAAIARR